MTEQKIEKKVLDKVEAAFEAAGIAGIQFVGAWQPATTGKIKGLEESGCAGVLGVKVFPRTYETPTIPDGSFRVDVALTVRAEVDSDGKDYLQMSEVLANVIHSWQKQYSNYATDFEIDGEFCPTGFVIDNSDVGLDRENCVWQYSQSFTLYGIIN